MKTITFLFAILFVAGLNIARHKIHGQRKRISEEVASGAAVGFSIGDKGYIGTGLMLAVLIKDFWEYDPCYRCLDTES